MLGFLHRNLLSIFLSFGLSFTLWAVIVNQQNPEVTRLLDPSIPLTVRNIPSGLVLSSVREETVRLRVTTTQDHLASISPTSFQAYVDLGKAEPGAREYPIRAESTDGQVRIEGVEPTQTEVRLAVQKRKNVPVRVNVLDVAPFGYEAGAPLVTPNQVEIVGPQNQVEAVVSAVIDLQLGGARTTISQSFRPEPRDGTGRQIVGVELNPSLVVVELDIEQQVAYKLVPVVPEITGSVALGYQIVGIVPDPATVTIVGEPQALDRVTQITTQSIEVNGQNSDLHRSTSLVLPSGISLARRQDVVVRVYVNSVQSSQLVRVTPTLRGGTDDTQVTVSPPTVDVTIAGPMPSLLQLRPQDVRIVIDITGRTPGTYTITPQVTYPSGLNLEKITPEQVSITIK
ncbi:MAG: CdaR family protein [Chloroflexota bacterium]